jgi:hypothetical protein
MSVLAVYLTLEKEVYDLQYMLLVALFVAMLMEEARSCFGMFYVQELQQYIFFGNCVNKTTTGPNI